MSRRTGQCPDRPPRTPLLSSFTSNMWLHSGKRRRRDLLLTLQLLRLTDELWPQPFFSMPQTAEAALCHLWVSHTWLTHRSPPPSLLSTCLGVKTAWSLRMWCGCQWGKVVNYCLKLVLRVGSYCPGGSTVKFLKTSLLYKI